MRRMDFSYWFGFRIMDDVCIRTVKLNILFLKCNNGCTFTDLARVVTPEAPAAAHVLLTILPA